MSYYIDICKSMFTEAQFTAAKKQNQQVCLSTDERQEKCGNYTQWNIYLAGKNMKFAAKWRKPE